MGFYKIENQENRADLKTQNRPAFLNFKETTILKKR